MTKELKILSNAMDLNAEITILIKYSPKREQMLEQIEELSLSTEDESERNQANRISKLTTRWTVRSINHVIIFSEKKIMYFMLVF